MIRRLRDYLFGFTDPRPMALFRIGLALLLIKDVLYRLPLAELYHSDSGLTPRWAVWSFTSSDHWSLLNLSGDTWFAVAILMVLLFAVSALLVGWHTRIASIIAFILLVSVQYRTEMIIDGSDFVMRVCLFWGMFSGWGAAYSVDARLTTTKTASLPRDAREDNSVTPIWAWPFRLMQFQIALVYFMSGIDKLYGVQWTQGTALYRVLQLKTFQLPTGELFVQIAPYPLVVALTYGTIVLEVAWLFLVFSPILQPCLRRIALIGGLLLHGGIALLMSIPNFSWVMLTSYLLFIEPHLIARFVGWITPRLRGLLSLITHLPRMPLRLPFRVPRVLIGTFLASCMALNLWWLAGTEWPNQPAFKMPDPARTVIHTLGLWQNWKMFSPDPATADRWVVFYGTYRDGRRINMRTGSTALAGLPRYWIGPELRTRKYDENMVASRPRPMLEAAAQYYCRTSTQIVSIEIRLRLEWTRAPGDAPQLPNEQLLHQQQCRTG